MITYGKRISYHREDKLLISHRIYSDGMKMVRVVINTEDMSFKFIDPATGVVHKVFSRDWSNLEVVQRNVKRQLKKYLGIQFEKEARKDEE